MREGLLQVLDIQLSDKAKWMTTYVFKWLFIILAVILYTIIVARTSEAKAAKKYEAWQQRFADEYTAQQEAKQLGMPVDPAELRLDTQAQMLARVLYGIKDNSEKDMKTYCWCVFNRVDSPDYPDSLEEVIEQPQQWMRYNPESPVLTSLYNIAREQILLWQNGTTRPVGTEFVFMNWSPTDLSLRDNWNEGSRTHYWRWGE